MATIPSWLITMRSLTGTKETAGRSSNPVIISWRDTIAQRFPEYAKYARTYTGDEIPWCGHAAAYVMAVNGIKPPKEYMWAANWGSVSKWPGAKRLKKPVLGCIMVFTRSGGGHVTLYERETETHYVVRGGNQSDSVNLSQYPKSRFTAAMWPPGAVPAVASAGLAMAAMSPDSDDGEVLEDDTVTTIAETDDENVDSSVNISTPIPPPININQPPIVADGFVRGDPELWHVQRRLRDLKYSPGGLDGIWGSRSSGAVAGFINDRHISMAAPTSLEMFHQIQEQLKTEIGKAESEQFKRPITTERATATEEVVEKKAPEIVPIKQGRFAAFWAAVSTAFLAVINAVADQFQELLTWLNSFKDHLNVIPGWVWLVGVSVGFAYFYFKSKKSAEAIVDSVRTGDRN